jgi:hypothetical protein
VYRKIQSDALFVQARFFGSAIDRMAEAKVRANLYAYQGNSNLVLQPEREGGPRTNEPTGEVRRGARAVWRPQNVALLGGVAAAGCGMPAAVACSIVTPSRC